MSGDDQGTPKVPEVVDFDALRAVLGDAPVAVGPAPGIGESRGQSVAAYASARPHAIPAARAPVVDHHAPAVIVDDDLAADKTLPSGPPAHMTSPMVGAPPFGSPATSAPRPAPILTSASRAPVPRSRMPRSPTLVMRQRGPTRLQKSFVFIAMLVVFVGGGIAVLAYTIHLDVNTLLVRIGLSSAAAPAPSAAGADAVHVTGAQPSPKSNAPTSSGAPTPRP